MTAPARRSAAATLPSAPFSRSSAFELWQQAALVRQEWLDHGLSTKPADRAAAEHHIARIYARVSRRRPRFEWVESPQQALPLVGGLPTVDQLGERVRYPRLATRHPLASDIAMSASWMRARLSAGVDHTDPELSPARIPKSKNKDPWPHLPPPDALARGVPLGVVLHQSVRVALHRSLATGFRQPVRAVLRAGTPLCWYGHQDAAWVGYYDTLRRLDLARYGPEATDAFADWVGLGQACGWWWPGEKVCVVVERPASVHTEPVPGAWDDEVRLRPGGVIYRDGWRPAVT